MEVFTYKDYDYPVKVIKKNIKNSYIRVKNKEIIITTNYLTTKLGIKKLIENNEKSIIKLINNSNKKEQKQDQFYLFGKKYDIIIGNFVDIDITDDKIYVKDYIILNKYLNKHISELFLKRLNYWYDLYEENIPVPNLKIRKMTSRWGVCNLKNNNVTLNSELYRYDIKCLDYVIVHELSHFIYPNHSPSFWKQVEKYYPNYKQARKMLKD